MALQNFPVRAMTRTRQETTLGDIFELDYSEDPQPRYFNSKTRRQNGMKYRIPEHQRHPQWKHEQKNSLIDTVFRNYPMNGIVVSEHVKDNGIYYDLEDGQTRLSNLQDFYMNEYPYLLDDGSEVYYKELPMSLQRRFENYRIYLEILSDIDEQSHDISEAFHRLQCGTPLKDKDLYWNRKDEYPLVKKAFTLINEPYWQSGYMNTVKGITDKHRNHLPDIITLIYAIINYNLKKSSEERPSKRKTFSKCFRVQVPELKIEISDADNARIEKFLIYLNEIISDVYTELSPSTSPKEKVNKWCNLAHQTGMILYEWLENETADEAVMEAHQEKWVEMINLDRRSGGLMFKGKKTMWNGMTSTNKQNTADASIAARLERVNEFYDNRETTAATYSIIYNHNQNVDGEEEEEVEVEVEYVTDSD